MTKISVIMPAYNCESYISESIKSILGQTFSDFEFIIINDGSTDSTLDIINQFAKDDERIKIINHETNKGLIYSLNEGIDNAKGEYIARMDADDISLPKRFEKQVEYLDNHLDVGVLGGGGQNFGANNDTNYSPEFVDLIELLRGVGFYHPSVMIRTKILHKNNIRYDSEYYLVEDHDLWARLLKYTKLRNLQEILIKYRVHSDSVSNKNRDLQQHNKSKIRRRLLESISTNPYYQKKIMDLACGISTTKEDYCYKILKKIPLITIANKSTNKRIIYLFNNIPLLKIKNDILYLFGLIKIGTLSKNEIKKVSFNNFYDYKIDNKNILKHLRNIGKFVYIPNSGNLGDMIIAQSTIGFFNDNNLSYEMFKFDMKQPETIVYGGGGPWIKEYEKSWKKWLPIFKRAKRVIILPSSFDNCENLIKTLDERFTVFCREEKSFKYLKEKNTKAEIILDHDMAFRLKNKHINGKFPIEYIDNYFAVKRLLHSISHPKKVIKFLRDDVEKANNLTSDLDISTLMYGESDSELSHIDFCAKLMFTGIDAADIVITDRLHVAIAASLLNKEVFMLDNSYCKLSNVYKHTMSKNKKIHFIDHIPEIKKSKSRKNHKNYEILKLI